MVWTNKGTYFSMPELICPDCGKKYWPKQAWIHAKCATNTEIATNSEPRSATNRVSGGSEPADSGLGQEIEGDGASVDVGRGLEGGGEDRGKTRNRRSRAAYNAYQRDYMRKRRAGQG